jgi:abortive infection bacteriophage resistance protein
MPKTFSTYEQQITQLKIKLLSITDETQAKIVLARIGYYPLICGYKHPFKNPTTKNYINGVKFEDIVALYTFDEGLRNLFFSQLLTIERALKSQIAYSFCEKYGEAQAQYLQTHNYNNIPRNSRGIQRLVDNLKTLATQPTDYPYINHYQNTHANVPLWVLINALTFGSMSKMFGFLPQSLQSKICRNYPVNTTQMEQVLIVLTKYRNACAHGERLFFYTTRDDIPDFPLHRKLGISKRGAQYIYGKHDLFAVVIALRYLLPSEKFLELKKILSKLITAFTSDCAMFAESQLLHSMGFPLNWNKITKYKMI